MDRITFLQSIDQNGNEFASTIIGFFDQFMALYSLVGSYKNVEVSNNESTNSFIRFTVSFDDSEKVETLQNIIEANNRVICAYGKIFNIQYELLNTKSIMISLLQ